MKQLREKYNDIVVMDQSIQESILKSLGGDGSSQLLPLQGAASVDDSQNNQLTLESESNSTEVPHESHDQLSVDQNDKMEDYVACPICDEGAMSDVMQCEDCLMWFHYECIGIDKNRADKIPESNPFICINCNDQHLYGGSTDNIRVQTDINPIKGQTSVLNMEVEKAEIGSAQNIPSNGREKKVMKSDVNPIQNKPSEVLSENKQAKVVKNSKVNMNNVSQKRKSNADTNENDQKSLIIQLERQIKEKDKTINLLQKINSVTARESPTDNGNEHIQNKKTFRDSGNEMGCGDVEMRMRQMEMNMCENMNMITNNNMQMSLQIQTLSNQLMMQSQQMMLQQQQQQQQFLNMNRTGGLPYVFNHVPTVLNPFNQTFNTVHPYMFYQRPVNNQQVFYQRPFNIQPNMYVPLQRTVYPQTVHHHQPTGFQQQPQQNTYHRQPVNETSVPSPSHVAMTENISIPDATVNGQSDISPGQDNVNVVGLHEQDVMNISITNTELNGREDTEASPEKTLNCHVTNHTPDVIVIDSSHSRNVNIRSENESVTSDGNKDSVQTEESGSKPTDSSFLCMPSRKHFPPDSQDLLIGEKLTERQ